MRARGGGGAARAPTGASGAAHRRGLAPVHQHHQLLQPGARWLLVSGKRAQKDPVFLSTLPSAGHGGTADPPPETEGPGLDKDQAHNVLPRAVVDGQP